MPDRCGVVRQFGAVCVEVRGHFQPALVHVALPVTETQVKKFLQVGFVICEPFGGDHPLELLVEFVVASNAGL